MDMELVLINILSKNINGHQTPNGDMEWVYMLNRQGYLVDLAIAFYLTKENKYLDKWKEIILDFIATNEAEILIQKLLGVY